MTTAPASRELAFSDSVGVCAEVARSLFCGLTDLVQFTGNDPGNPLLGQMHELAQSCSLVTLSQMKHDNLPAVLSALNTLSVAPQRVNRISLTTNTHNCGNAL